MMAAQPCEQTRKLSDVQFKWVNWMVYERKLNKAKKKILIIFFEIFKCLLIKCYNLILNKNKVFHVSKISLLKIST